MKKFNLFKFGILFCALAMFFAGISIFNLNNGNGISAETISVPDYFTAQLVKQPGEKTKFTNNSSIFLSDNKIAELTLGGDNIDSISYMLEIDGNSYSNEQLKNKGVIVEWSGNVFKLTLTTKPDEGSTTKRTPFGNFKLSFSYFVNGFSKSFSFEFFALDESVYLTAGTSVNVAYSNITQTSKSDIYANIFEYFYNTTQLPSITFEKNRFMISIVKTNLNITKYQTLKFDGTKIISSGDNLVYVNESANSNTANIVFNDQGVYAITYGFLYTVNSTVYTLPTPTGFTFPVQDKISLLGYQLYYTDINNNGVKEFKGIDAKGEISKNITDVTSYLNKAGFNNSTTLENINSHSTIKVLLSTIAETNQAPVQFKYNVYIDNNVSESSGGFNSQIYVLNKDNNFEFYTDKDNNVVKYENQPLAASGTYLIKVSYKTKSSSSGAENLKVQWFMFSIISNTPSVSIYKMEDTNKIILSDGSFSGSDVHVEKSEKFSVFNAQTEITISYSANYNNLFTNPIIITPENPFIASANGKYKVTYKFGKNLGSFYETFFSIDKTEIENVKVSTVKAISSSMYVKNTQVNFFTNESVVVSWNDKNNIGNKTKAKYKFIPLIKNNNIYTSQIYTQLLSSSKGIPVSYNFDYNGSVLNEIVYSNTNNESYVQSESVLSQSGLYIFTITDQAGHTKTVAFVIDNTSPEVLQKIDNEYINVSDLNILSNDVLVEWGEKKLLSFSNISVINNKFTAYDKTLETLLNNALYQDYFNRYTVSASSTCFVIVPLNNIVWLEKNLMPIQLNGKTNYQIKFLNNNVADESQYNFYLRDNSNTKVLLGSDSNSYENYSENYSTLHKVNISSDSSQTTLFYYNSNNKKSSLDKSGYAPEPVNGIKESYFNPTTKATLSSSNETLFLTFDAVPELNKLEVETISYKHYPFIPDTNGNSTYIFANTATEINIYDKNNPANNKASINNEGYYEWEVLKEFDSKTQKYQTKAGKYVITRTYDTSLADYELTVNGKYDFGIRTFTFIIDRNGIITQPVVVDSQAGLIASYVGGSIILKVLENNLETFTEAMYFKDIFIAENSGGTQTSILDTNKLPVTVFIPKTKYGYSSTDGGEFNIENSIHYYGNSEESAIKMYELSAKISFSKSLTGLEKPNEVYVTNGDVDISNNYLWFYKGSDRVNKINSFKDIGYYKVEIKQSNNSFSYIFQIVSAEPDFEISNKNNIKLNSDDNGKTNYTNQEEIRVSWTDPSSEFMAKINQNTITYSVNGGKTVTINPNNIFHSQNYNYFDLKLKDIKAYTNGSQINITMQFEGSEESYAGAKFKTSKTVVIDLVAPINNITRLIQASGLNELALRSVSEKYNVSNPTGLYQYFAFSVDKSNYSTLLKLMHSTGNTEIFNSYYRKFTTPDGINTKYKEGYLQETPVSVLENSLLNHTTIMEESDVFGKEANTYIEIVETDLAGNITVYTIYITDKNNGGLNNTIPTSKNYPAITYSSNNISKTVTNENLNSNISLFAKNNFNITKTNFYDYPWLTISANNELYVRTPYTTEKNQLYKASEYVSNSLTNPLYQMQEITNINASSEIKTIRLGLVPFFNSITLKVSCLSTNLEVLLANTIVGSENSEGILIKIPNTNTQTTASIYGQLLVIEKKDLSVSNDSLQVLQTIGETYTDYFKSVQPTITVGSVKLETVTYASSSYFKITILNPQKDVYYKYTITDNFSDVISKSNIYGSPIISDEITSAVPVITSYVNGVLTYYSTKDIKFNFYSKKDYIKIKYLNGTNPITYSTNPTGEERDMQAFVNEGIGKYDKNNSTGIFTITFYAAKLDMVEGKNGGNVIFNVEVYSLLETKAIKTNSFAINIYNITPRITLIGNDENQNELFNKETMYGGTLSIQFSLTAGQYPYKVKLQMPDGSISEISSNKLVTEKGTYRIIISYTELFTSSVYDTVLEFIISDQDEDFYSVTYDMNGENKVAKATGEPFTYTVGGITQSISVHYILNTSNYNILKNTYLKIEEESKKSVVVSGFTTYIHTLSNLKYNVSKYFQRQIAITIIPQASNLITTFVHYNNTGATEKLSGTQSTFFVSKEEDNSSSKKIAWSPYYGIPENKIKAVIYFGTSTTPYIPEVTKTQTNLNVITLSTSGVYYISFEDVAGNKNLFESFSETYTIRYLKNVIFDVNGTTPVNNAIYDNEVTVTIDSTTLKYYDTNARPKIKVEKNGEDYTSKITSDTSKNIYYFKESGLYKVWFSASINSIAINENPTYFTIINKNESRWAFEISEYSNYYIEEIYKDNGNGPVNITKELTTKNMGNLITITKTELVGDINVTKTYTYLKNILINITDEKTGAGRWTIKMNANNAFNQTFTFSFWINKQDIPISVSLKNGESTTKDITVQFNTRNILATAGECTLYINNMIPIKITQELLDQGKIKETYSIKLVEPSNYFVELKTDSGKLLYSYFIVKNAPLNTITIVLIVISSVIAISGLIIFILLRKRMKIR